jgi:hypothetical protein
MVRISSKTNVLAHLAIYGVQPSYNPILTRRFEMEFNIFHLQKSS